MEKYAQLSQKDVRQAMKGSYNRFRNLLYYNANAINLLDYIHHIVNSIEDVKKLQQLLRHGYDTIKLAEEIVNHGSIELNKTYLEYHRELPKKNIRQNLDILERYQLKVVTKGDFEKFQLFCHSGNLIFPSVEEELIRRHCRPLMNSNSWLEILFREHELSEKALETLSLSDCSWAWKKYQDYHEIPKKFRRRHFWRGFIKLFSP